MVWRYSNAIVLLPLGISLAAAALLAINPQILEVYISLIEEREYAKGFLALGGLFLFGGLLHVWYWLWADRRITNAYHGQSGEEYIGDKTWEGVANAIRDWLALVCLLLPAIGALVGLFLLSWDAYDAKLRYGTAIDYFRFRVSAGADTVSTSRALDPLPLQILCAAAFPLLSGMLVGTVMYVLSANRRLQQIVLGMSSVLAAVAVIGPLVGPNTALALAWQLGPLVVVAALLIAIAAALLLLSWFTEITRWPWITLCVLAALAVGVFKLDTYGQTGESIANRKTVPDAKVAEQFDAWLAARRDRERYQKYPVFIFAVQGGGIYAAASSAMYLAMLEDACPGFAEHVFAVSAVSGGAVGAALFEAMTTGVRSRPDNPAGCRPSEHESIGHYIRDIVLADHLSPVLAFIAPDLLDKIVPLRALGVTFETWNRARALEESFARTFDQAVAGTRFAHPGVCFSNQVGGLRAPFEYHWCPKSPAPALMLNATWVETGYRVAFSPFPLYAVGDRTLYAFSDLHGKLASLRELTSNIQVDQLSLIEAAIVSARFPGILPSWSRTHAFEGKSANYRWNFVDGGYADASGVTTALELYNLLSRHIDSKKIDLRFVILTDLLLDPNFREINGYGLSDTLVPITALLNVRSLLAGQAVTRASSQNSPGQPDPKILLVKLDQGAFPLPLGWKISRTSLELISFGLGRPSLCKGDHVDNAIPSGAKSVIDNSCVTRRIHSLLSGNE